MDSFNGFGGGASGGGGAGGDFGIDSLNLSAGKIQTPSNDAAPNDASITDSRLNSLNIPTELNTTPIVTFGGLPLNDKRVRISPLSKSTAISFVGLLSPLANTNGVLFPFQPKIDISYSANYQTQKVAQSNFAFHNYEQSELKAIDFSCDFPVRNQFEGRYVIAAMTYLRSLTMMFTGNDGQYAGSPPLIVSLIGMGFGGLDNIPVVITNVTTSYPDNIDFVSISLPNPINDVAKVPTLMNISVSCQPMFSRAFASNFSTRQFAMGTQRMLGPNYVPPTQAVAADATATPSQAIATTNNQLTDVMGMTQLPTLTLPTFGA